MTTDSYKEFLANCKNEVQKKNQIKLSKGNRNIISSEVFSSFDNVKQVAASIRGKFLNNIADNISKFDKNFTDNGGDIFWCINYNDFIDKLDKLLENKKIRNVNLFPSKFSEELGVEWFINNNNNINNNVQSEDCIIFTPKFGIINTGSLFLNFQSSIDMEIVLRSKMKIFLLPINEFLFKLEEVEIFAHLYSIYHDEVEFPYLTSIFTPSPIEKDKNTYLFLVDNGRSNIMENKDISKILTCISCDACKNVCPVYSLIGDKPYNNVFTGPVGNVVLPYMENIDSYKHLSFSCTSCGNCSAVCPVQIPISELIIKNKKYFFENKLMDMQDERFGKAMYRSLYSRKRMNAKNWIKKLRVKMLSNSKVIEQYTFSKYSFNQQFLNNDGNNK